MANPVVERIYSWYSSVQDGQEIQDALVLIQQLADELYGSYEPTKGPQPNFWKRLDGWLNKDLSEAEQKLLFRFVPHVFYVGPEEFDSLNRVAFNGPIARWLVDELKLDFMSGSIQSLLAQSVKKTWFCPITDSLRINGFYHVNHITGRDLRSDWRTLSRFDDQAKVMSYLATEKIERVVLLEDFVGSGSQIEEALHFAGRFTTIPILVVPLICCQAGVELGRQISTTYSNISFTPVLRITDDDCLSSSPAPTESAIFAAMRDVVLKTYPMVSAGLSPSELSKLYGPFGFSDTGGLVVLWTNCPDNTLPIIHQDSKRWIPLFPRASRL